jgi:Copper binding proteins, plastocyanin/azurin family
MIDHMAAGAAVSILVGSFAPTHTAVLAGDSVMWTNDSVRRHTVTAVDSTWSSSDVLPGEQYMHTFDQPGAFTYYCKIHPFMRGEVDVYRLLLTNPVEPGAPGGLYTLIGQSSLPPGTEVSIQAATGDTFSEVTRTTVGDDGSVRAAVVPSETTRYRAVAGDETSPPVQLMVLDRHVTATSTRHGDRTIVRVRVTPASPHATVVLQLHLRERFGWWPVRRARLDHHSRATFRLRLHRRVSARVVLTLADGATQLARSGELRIGVRSRQHR